MVAHVPERYQNYEILEFQENDVATFGVFDLTIDGEEHGLLLPSIIHLQPSSIEKISSSEGKVFYDLHFETNDIFISNTMFLKIDSLVYVAFLEFIQYGKLPKFLDYTQTAFLMALLSKICGLRFDVNHAIVEIMISHLCRDQKNPNIFYRQTDYKNPPKFIPLAHISYGTTSTTSKLLGSYLTDGIRSALVNQNDVSYEFETILKS
jgi:hypothetical protein